MKKKLIFFLPTLLIGLILVSIHLHFPSQVTDKIPREYILSVKIGLLLLCAISFLWALYATAYKYAKEKKMNKGALKKLSALAVVLVVGAVLIIVSPWQYLPKKKPVTIETNVTDSLDQVRRSDSIPALAESDVESPEPPDDYAPPVDSNALFIADSLKKMHLQMDSVQQVLKEEEAAVDKQLQEQEERKTFCAVALDSVASVSNRLKDLEARVQRITEKKKKLVAGTVATNVVTVPCPPNGKKTLSRSGKSKGATSKNDVATTGGIVIRATSTPQSIIH